MRSPALVVLLLLAFATFAHAHGGGGFRGPPGGVPPGPRTSPPHPPPPSEAHAVTATPRLPRALPTWWERHAPELLDLKRHLYAPHITSSTPLIWSGRYPTRRDEERPMRRAVQSIILPTLRIALDDLNLHREIRNAILIALGRLGALEHAPTINTIARDNRAPPALAEAALLSLGLMRTEPGQPDSDRIDGWIHQIACSRNVAKRNRGLARMLGGVPDRGAPTTRCSDADRARFLLTSARQRNARWLSMALAWLDDPAAPPLTRRAAAVAAGLLARDVTHSRRGAIVDRLRWLVRARVVDPELQVLACYALADIGTTNARLDLIDFAQTRSIPVRIASLFALHEFLDELSPIQRDTLRTAASRLEGPADYTPMMDLCRGLYGDSAAIPNLLRHLPRPRHAALALGLLGNASTEVLDALWCQLKRTKDPAAQRNITFALTMLRARDVDIYVEDRLATARTFADQASWIETIGRVGTHIHVPALIAILHDTRRSVALRAAAVQALGRMGDLRPHSPFPEATHVFAPGLGEPRIDTWLAQR